MACVDGLLCQLMYSIVIIPCVFVILHQRTGVYSDESYVSRSARTSAVAAQGFGRFLAPHFHPAVPVSLNSKVILPIYVIISHKYLAYTKVTARSS